MHRQKQVDNLTTYTVTLKERRECDINFYLSFFLPGGPFDLMSRRLIVASSRMIAERIAKEITEFHVGRDDTDD